MLSARRSAVLALVAAGAVAGGAASAHTANVGPAPSSTAAGSHVASSGLPGAPSASRGTSSASSAPLGGRPSRSPIAGLNPALPCDATTSGGDWPSYGHDAFNTRNQPLETGLTPATGTGLTPKWTFSLSSAGDAGQLESTPVTSGGCVFVASSAGAVYALNATTGTPIWHHAVAAPSPGLGGAIVGSLVADGGRIIVLVDQAGDGTSTGPYLEAFNQQTGAVAWTSKPITVASGFYTNGSPAVFNGVVFAGYSPPEGQNGAQGGFALFDERTGALLDVTTTVSPADQAQGYAGGGIWSTPAWDPGTGYAYVGTGNPYSKTLEDVHTNAIIKIDVKRGRATFGKIVASYKGNVDQYTQALQQLSQTPACAASAQAPTPLDDPVCGQLDLDFGAAPNLFRVNGRLVVGDLQKSGVYHVADALSMAPVWSTIVGASCQACNAASTAAADGGVFGEGTPGGVAFGLGQATGSLSWAVPVGDGAHYQSTSVANGFVYTTDTAGFFDIYTTGGTLVARRPITADVGAPAASFTSGGIAIAYHTVFVAASEGGVAGTPVSNGYLVAYS